MSARISTQAFFDPNTWTVTYLVVDSASRHAAIIDPVLDYDFKSGHTSTNSADKVLACVAVQAFGTSTGFLRRMPMPTTCQAHTI